MNTPIDVSKVVLRTERLVLRPWRQSDLQDLYSIASMDGVGQMCGWHPHTRIDESQAMLDKLISGKTAFALERNGHVIGMLGIPRYNEEAFPQFDGLQCRELSFILSKNEWGQGLMPEAVREVIRYLFEDIGLDVIFCGHFVFNRRSARLQEKLGFHLCGFTKYQTRMGTVEDNRVNFMTRDEWLERRALEIAVSQRSHHL